MVQITSALTRHLNGDLIDGEGSSARRTMSLPLAALSSTPGCTSCG
jgi:hypothetical protein